MKLMLTWHLSSLTTDLKLFQTDRADGERAIEALTSPALLPTSSNSGDGWGNQGGFYNMLDYDNLTSLKSAKMMAKLELLLDKEKAWEVSSY
ncbi:hypothetical protein CFP56_025692 [Quercus suber]|uniref:Uncharacterized protein n=1 Tax=Quercus suber TaxID=58331 RepID=A0AAW0K377_QUESU